MGKIGEKEEEKNIFFQITFFELYNFLYRKKENIFNGKAFLKRKMFFGGKKLFA